MNRHDLFIKMILHAWELNVTRATKAFNGFSDEELFTEVAPGKNRVIYLLGHLVAVHDRMLPLLGLGERNYPQLDEPFINNPDKAIADLPTVQELRIYWNDINMILEGYFKNLTPDEWLVRHTTVSEEDFAKEPHRNRLSIVINRTNHLSYHLGQIVLAKK